MTDIEKIREALAVFALEQLPRRRFSDLPGLLKKRYHLLAKKVHPDHSGYQTELFIRLRSHFELLQQTLDTAPEQIKQLLGDDVFHGLPRDTSGKAFSEYKAIVFRMNRAINAYFAATEQVVVPEFRNKSYQLLAEELMAIRGELLLLAKKNPRAIWIDDAQRNLGKLDIWLRESQSSAS